MTFEDLYDLDTEIVAIFRDDDDIRCYTLTNIQEMVGFREEPNDDLFWLEEVFWFEDDLRTFAPTLEGYVPEEIDLPHLAREALMQRRYDYAERESIATVNLQEGVERILTMAKNCGLENSEDLKPKLAALVE